jgi:hypothetical protein
MQTNILGMLEKQLCVKRKEYDRQRPTLFAIQFFTKHF